MRSELAQWGLRYTAWASAVLLALSLEWLSPVYGLALLAVWHVVAGNIRRPNAMSLTLLAWGVWQVATIGWAEHKSEGWSDAMRTAPIMVLPILGDVFKLNLYKRRIWQAFSLGVFLAWNWIFFSTLFAHGWAGYKDFLLFPRLGLHYQSLFLLTAALVMERRAWLAAPSIRLLLLLSAFWLVIGIVLLSARIHLAILAVVMIWRTVEAWRSNPRWRKRISQVFTVLFLTMVGLVFTLPTTRSRLTDLVNEVRSIDGMVNGKQTNHRVYIWKYASEIIEDHFWLGTGNGDEEHALSELLEQCDAPFYRGTERYYLNEGHYDYHNMYLQAWAQGGLVEVILLLAVLIVAFVKLKNWKRIALVAFMLMGLTESLLDRQAGVFFFAFMLWSSTLLPPVKADR